MGFKRWFRRVILRRKPKARPRFKPVFIDGSLVDVQVDRLTGMKKKEKVLFLECSQLICKIANSKEFKERVARKTLVFDHNEGMNPRQIYENFLSGATVANPRVDRTLNIDYNLYYTITNTIGYVITGDSSDKINFNKKFLRYSIEGKATIVGNFFHEDRHNAGFWHEKTDYSRWNVPYFYGDTAKYLALKYLQGNTRLTPIGVESKQ